MKKLSTILALFIISLGLLSCNEDTSGHEVRYSDDGRDSTVYVRYRDDNGNMQSFWMNYMLFQTMMNSGNNGYSNAYNYHRSHYEDPLYKASYNKYKIYENTGNYNSGYRSNDNVTRPSTPTRNYNNTSVTTPSSTRPSTPTRSYSPPVRPSTPVRAR